MWVTFCRGNAQRDSKSNVSPLFPSAFELKEEAGRSPELTHPLAGRVKMTELASKRMPMFISRQKSGAIPSSRQATAENLTFSSFQTEKLLLTARLEGAGKKEVKIFLKWLFFWCTDFQIILQHTTNSMLHDKGNQHMCHEYLKSVTDLQILKISSSDYLPTSEAGSWLSRCGCAVEGRCVWTAKLRTENPHSPELSGRQRDKNIERGMTSKTNVLPLKMCWGLTTRHCQMPFLYIHQNFQAFATFCSTPQLPGL